MPRPKRPSAEYKLVQLTADGNWYITYSEGRRSKRLSTGTTDEATAQQYRQEFVAGRNAPPAEDQQTVGMALDAYLAYKKGHYELRNDNVEHYRSLYSEIEYKLVPIRVFFEHIKLTILTRQHGRDYIRHRQNTAMKKVRNKATGEITEQRYLPSNATIAKELKLLNAALNYVKGEWKLAQVATMQTPPAPPARDKWMRPEQCRVFLTVCDTPHVKLFTLLGLHTLSRKTAILQLKWSQVDMNKRVIQFNPPERMVTNKRRAVVPINNILYSALKDAHMLRETDYVIEYGGKPIYELRNAFLKTAKRAGVPWVTPHTLRHTGATLMAANGVPLWEIAGIMGDTIETVTKHYAKHHPDYLKGATDKLEAIYG